MSDIRFDRSAAPPLHVQPSSVLDILALMDVPLADPHAAAQSLVTLRRLRPGDTLFLEGTRAESIHFVRSGTFKVTCTSEDGYEQVLGFADRREVLGLDALGTLVHPTSAVALEDCSVYALAVTDVLPLSRRVPEFNRVLHLAASASLCSRAQLIDVMAAVGAEVRLARFLVQWSRRMAANEQSPTRFLLRMCRRDLASHLGLAHATVSRSFGALADWGLVQVNNRDVEILDLPGLKAFARSTRRPSDDGSIWHGPAHRALGPAARAHGGRMASATAL